MGAAHLRSGDRHPHSPTQKPSPIPERAFVFLRLGEGGLLPPQGLQVAEDLAGGSVHFVEVVHGADDVAALEFVDDVAGVGVDSGVGVFEGLEVVMVAHRLVVDGVVPLAEAAFVVVLEFAFTEGRVADQHFGEAFFPQHVVGLGQFEHRVGDVERA